MHEPLEADGSVGQRQMSMEHGAGLQIVEVVLIDRGTKRVERSPKYPENPDERYRGDGNGDQSGTA